MGVYAVKNLKQIRQSKCPDINEFAEKAKCSKRTIERAENLKDKVSLYTIGRIATVLGIDKNDIIDKERSFPKEKLDSLAIIEEDKNKSYFKLGMKKYKSINEVEKIIKVRYMGRTGPIYLENDKLNTLFFTTDLENPIYDCNIDISMTMKESNFLKVVNKLYLQYEDKPLDLNGLDESYFDKEVIDMLNRKIISLRMGEEVTMRTVGEDFMEIVDFYPKGRLTHQDEIYNLVQTLLYELEKMETISLENSLIPMGFEIMDKIIRCSLTASEKIVQYVENNIVDLLYMREMFIILTYILTSYIDGEVSESEAQEQINSTYENIRSQKKLLEKLDELYGFEKVERMYRYMEKRMMVNG